MRLFLIHRHPGPDKLSEYLDARLPGGERGRVTEHLESCSRCREELDSLRATISHLRQLPQHTLPRSFTLAGPPPQIAAGRSDQTRWVPAWAYAGAASLAALALGLLVFVDLSSFPASPSPGTGARVTQRSLAQEPLAAQSTALSVAPPAGTADTIKPKVPQPVVGSTPQLYQEPQTVVAAEQPTLELPIQDSGSSTPTPKTPAAAARSVEEPEAKKSAGPTAAPETQAAPEPAIETAAVAAAGVPESGSPTVSTQMPAPTMQRSSLAETPTPTPQPAQPTPAAMAALPQAADPPAATIIAPTQPVAAALRSEDPPAPTARVSRPTPTSATGAVEAAAGLTSPPSSQGNESAMVARAAGSAEVTSTRPPDAVPQPTENVSKDTRLAIAPESLAPAGPQGPPGLAGTEGATGPSGEAPGPDGPASTTMELADSPPDLWTEPISPRRRESSSPWRVAQGVAAALLLLFVGGLFWEVRRSRHAGANLREQMESSFRQ